MSFEQQGQRVLWCAVPEPVAATVCTTTATASLLDVMLSSFDGAFTEPHGLPPPRSRDHDITLQPGALPVAVRPYCYPATHKDELEHQCAAMLEQGLIRKSSSAFASPVLLVKRADGSWRFCVDYRALNAITVKDVFPVKDAFPIPVVDELLDELHDTKFFTKLNLRSGYHQVRMRAANIDKTAFHTHDSLYEFMVMSFGLCIGMATGTYPMGTCHPYPHPPSQNLFHRVTRESRRVRNSFHTRTRRVILTRRVFHTRKYT